MTPASIAATVAMFVVIPQPLANLNRPDLEGRQSMIHAVSNANCQQCGVPFDAARRSARYCCPACRQAHHRGDVPKVWRFCEGLDCDNPIPPWVRRDARYCTPQCRAHDYYAYGGPPIPTGAWGALAALLTEKDTGND